MGLATAMGSLGQFVFAPLGQSFIGAFGPVTALVLIGGCVAFVPVLAARAERRATTLSPPPDRARLAVREALTHPSFLLLASGFFVCGFHIAFVSTHLPPYLTELGLSTALAAWALGLIGLFNVVGAYTAGILGGTYSRRLLLSGIYASRAAAFALFVVLPPTPATVLLFAAAIGLLWLSTVPLTSGLIAVMFGTRHPRTAVRDRLPQPPDRRVRRCLAGRHGLRRHRRLRRSCGGRRSRSASPPPSCTCRSTSDAPRVARLAASAA